MSRVVEHYENLCADKVKTEFVRFLKLFDKEFKDKKAVVGASAAALYIIDEVQNNESVEAKFTFNGASTTNGEIGDWELIVRKLNA